MSSHNHWLKYMLLLQTVLSFLHFLMHQLSDFNEGISLSLIENLYQKIIVLFSDLTIMHTFTNEKDLIYSVNAF